LPQSLRLLGCLTLALGLCAAARAADSEPGPAAAVDAFHAALKSHDTATALKLLAPDASILEQGFVDRTRADYAGAHIAADAAFAEATEFKVLERRIIWLGDNAACVISQTRTIGRFENQSINLIGTETALLQRAGGTWSITHIHWSAHPGDAEPKPAAEDNSKKPAAKP
jgi:ketosteroid isomerase-like protein